MGSSSTASSCGHLPFDYKTPREDMSEGHFRPEDTHALFSMLHVDLSLSFLLFRWETPGKYPAEGPETLLTPFRKEIFPFCKEMKALVILSLLLLCKVSNVFVPSKKELAWDERDSCIDSI